jgi:DNA-binding response OmpR family regulator
MTKKVLIVEDDFDLSDAFRTTLTLAKYDVHVAENGKKALEYLETDQPDIILLDVLMPVMDGREFLRKFDNKSDTPVVVLSNLDGKDDIDELLGLGAQNYLLKSSINPDTLVTLVSSTLDAHRQKVKK